VQKLRRGGYDGRGVLVVAPGTPESQMLQGPSVLEEKAEIDKEIAVIAARNPSGEVVTFPAVEMVFDPRANLLDFLLSPAQLSPDIAKMARSIAADLVEKMNHTGVLAVEMFLCQDGSLWVNEVAPRPHNSGHQSLECNITSQYAQHLRAIMDLPLGATDIIRPGIMLNLLGEPGEAGIAEYLGLEEAYRVPGAYVHLYGKRHTKPYRKMGHITVTANAMEDAVMKGLSLKDKIRIVAAK
jgi:5-(carboxyamino)imidazole ribonucleotide synthase